MRNKKFLNELKKHLQLTDEYYIEQDKNDKFKIYIWKCESGIQELIGSYIFENTSQNEIFEVGKEILGDIFTYEGRWI